MAKNGGKKKAPPHPMRPDVKQRLKDLSEGMSSPIRSFVLLVIDEKGEVGITNSVNHEMDLKQLHFHMDELKVGLMQYHVRTRHEMAQQKALGQVH